MYSDTANHKALQRLLNEDASCHTATAAHIGTLRLLWERWRALAETLRVEASLGAKGDVEPMERARCMKRCSTGGSSSSAALAEALEVTIGAIAAGAWGVTRPVACSPCCVTCTAACAVQLVATVNEEVSGTSSTGGMSRQLQDVVLSGLT